MLSTLGNHNKLICMIDQASNPDWGSQDGRLRPGSRASFGPVRSGKIPSSMHLLLLSLRPGHRRLPVSAGGVNGRKGGMSTRTGKCMNGWMEPRAGGRTVAPTRGGLLVQPQALPRHRQAEARRRGGLMPHGGGLGSTQCRAARPPHSPLAPRAAGTTPEREQDGLSPRAGSGAGAPL